MIAQFGEYDPSINYVARNGSYLLYVNSRFLVPIVKSQDGWFLVGGGIECGESESSCLQRETMEEIGGRTGELLFVCENKTYFYSDKFGDMRKAHNYFFYTDTLEIYTDIHEDIGLYWFTFSEAIARLTLEHQKWALQYFRDNIKTFVHNKEILDSVVFIEGLMNNDIASIISVPKSDLHNHAVFGSDQNVFEEQTGIHIANVQTPFEDFMAFSTWCDKQVSDVFRSKEGFLTRIRTALITAELDHIDKLCFNIGVCSMKFFSSAKELIDTIEKLRKKYYSGKYFIPELCLDRSKVYNESYLSWFYELLDSNYFLTADLVGDEALPIEPIIPLFREMENRGIILKAHIAEYMTSKEAITSIKLLHLAQVQHGNMFINDFESIKWLKENKIQLNMCPSSNYFLSRIKDISEHPIKTFFRYGLNVTVNTDDVLIFGNTVSQEFLTLFQHNVLGAEELNQIRLNGLYD